MTRTGWSNLAILALCLAIICAQTIFMGSDWWWVVRMIGVGGFAAVAVRCTIAAAHAPERRYTR